MHKQVYISLCIAICALPTVLHAEELSGSDLRAAAAARRAARLAESTTVRPAAPEETTTVRKPFSTEPLDISREEARARALAKLDALRSAKERREARQQATSATKTPEPSVDIVGLRQHIVDLTNAERKAHGLAAYKVSSFLEKSAQAQADDMYERNFFSHTNPDGEEPTDRIQKTGYLDITFENCDCTSWRYSVGENIAKGQQTPEEAVRDWMNSPPHKAAILSTEYIEIGVGIVDNIWVQNFGAVRVKR